MKANEGKKIISLVCGDAGLYDIMSATCTLGWTQRTWTKEEQKQARDTK